MKNWGGGGVLMAKKGLFFAKKKAVNRVRLLRLEGADRINGVHSARGGLSWIVEGR